MKSFKLSFYLVSVGLFFAIDLIPTSTMSMQDRSSTNYIHLNAVGSPIQDGLSTRLFFPSSPKEQFIKQLK
ncbi:MULTISPECIES: hypothetical protein [Sphingobacterium]|uniref:hypothetical protein n=1 Tax=Sphingobacterium TaxID=28453 RepID=UPI00257B9E32|nr:MULTISPECIES: hypothetical protein [Sphingobacterium]